MHKLYGRDSILVRARACIDAAFAKDAKIALFTGEPGIGKSRLLEQIASEAAQRGAQLAVGRAWEVGGAPAYWPWVQVFRALSMDDDPFVGSAAGLAVLPKEGRFAEFDRAVQRLREKAAERPLVLVLDDLHAADEPSLMLLLFLVRSRVGVPLLVLGAYRDAELALRPEVATLLAKIAREAEVTPLARLSEGDLDLWLRDASIEAEALHDVYRLTEGHPLYTVEALRLLQAQGARRPRELDASRGALAILEEQLGRLSLEARAMLRVAAVFGREFSLFDVAAAAETSRDLVHDALREAAATHVVVPAGERDVYRFSHVLLRDRLYDELAPTRRAALHAAAGNVVLTRAGDVQTAAHHLLLGQSDVRPKELAEVVLAAGRAALSRLAFEEAVRLARAALSVPDVRALGDLFVELELLLAEALIRVGRSAEGRAMCLDIAAQRESEARPELLARAALVYSAEIQSGAVDDPMVALLRRALTCFPEQDSPLRARLLARLAAALTPPRATEHIQEVLALTRNSMSMARKLGDPDTLLYVVQLAATISLMVSEQERFAALEETVALARSQDRPLVMLQTLPAYLTALLARGKRREVDALLQEHGALLSQARQAPPRVRWLIIRALLCALDGDLPAAEQLGEEARVVAQSAGSSAAYFLYVAHRFGLGQMLARVELLAMTGSTLVTELFSIPSTLTYLAWYYASTGRHDEARQILTSVELPPPNPSESLWELSGAAEACVLLDDRDFGARLYPHAVRAADRMFWSLAPGALLGPSARALGDLALLIGRTEDAVRHYDEAIAFCEAMRAVPLVEQCRARRAVALARLSPSPPEPSSRAPAMNLDLRRDGDVWILRCGDGNGIRLKHGKGVEYLSYLLDRPGRDIHVLELAAVEHVTGDAGPVLDAEAKAAYRTRLEALQEELAEAERFRDAARASRAEQEIDALTEQLATAVGLGGRDRRAASDVERMRINVQRRLKDAIRRIGAADPALGRYLDATIKTGSSCVYQPV